LYLHLIIFAFVSEIRNSYPCASDPNPSLPPHAYSYHSMHLSIELPVTGGKQMIFHRHLTPNVRERGLCSLLTCGISITATVISRSSNLQRSILLAMSASVALRTPVVQRGRGEPLAASNRGAGWPAPALTPTGRPPGGPSPPADHMKGASNRGNEWGGSAPLPLAIT
jgi:hypothetical protein